MHASRACLAGLIAAGLCLAQPAAAADSPFERNLLRLSEILGSLHFLRNLCGEESDQWLAHMEALLEAEDPDAERRERFIATFNRGYRAYARNYKRCTPSAIEAIERYMEEGEKLSRDTASRFGN